LNAGASADANCPRPQAVGDSRSSAIQGTFDRLRPFFMTHCRRKRPTMSPNNRSELEDRNASQCWAVTSLLALLVVAFAALFLRSEQRPAPFLSPGPRSAPEQSRDEGGRGRLATAPSEIPPRGWKDILLRVFANVSNHRILALAAGMTYYSLLAIFPAL